MEGSGLIYAQRTSGRFVTEDTARIRQAKEKLASMQVREFIRKMQELGMNREEIAELFSGDHPGGRVMSECLSCLDLTKRFGAKEALRSVNFKLEKGRIVGLLGPNGSGKTTLLKLVSGLLQPTDGSVLIEGMPPGIETKRKVSYLPDQMYLGDWMRVRDIIEYFQDFYEDFDGDRARAMLETLGIRPSQKIRAMSKGTREKVQLILVMSRRASLYCLDEPIAGVDPAARDYILSVILDNFQENSTLLISTHLIADVENILDEVIFLKEGRVVLQSMVEDIRMEQGKSVDGLFREVFRC